jgi:hypothetical protein
MLDRRALMVLRFADALSEKSHAFEQAPSAARFKPVAMADQGDVPAFG